MNQKDQTPSNTPDPQWDELVARLRGNESPTQPAEPPAKQREEAETPPEAQTSAGTDSPASQESAAQLLPGEQKEPPAIPHEPSAAEREAALHKLFNTGPLARGPRDYEVTDDPEEQDFTPQEPPALGAGDPSLILSWVAAAGGALGLLLCVIFVRDAPAVLYSVLAVSCLIGVIMLLRRLPKDRDPGDDGARV
ncbi:hypothetical protein [Glutamicibacter uratoxydans]|uniref:hypothetical protein n=1 Tax=Glutamicibacter uratoxydans TaxID=43667 RepID=UPI003D6E50B9